MNFKTILEEFIVYKPLPCQNYGIYYGYCRLI